MPMTNTIVIAWMSDRIDGWSSRGKKRPQACVWMNDVEPAAMDWSLKGADMAAAMISLDEGNDEAVVFAFVGEEDPLGRARHEIEFPA